MDIKMILSIFIGALFAIAAFVIFLFVDPEIAFPVAILAGALTSLSMHISLVISEKRMNKTYEAIEKEITYPILYKTNGNITTENNVKNGNIYFCRESLIIISADDRPHLRADILKSNIEGLEFDVIHMVVHIKDGTAFLISLPNAQEVRKDLENIDWL